MSDGPSMDAGRAGPGERRALVEAAIASTQDIRPLIAGSYVLSLASTLLKLALPAVVGLIINAIQSEGVPGMARSIEWIGLLAFCLAIGWIIRVPAKLAQFRVAARARKEFVGRIADRILHAPLAWHDAHHSGDTTQRINQGAGALYGLAQQQFAYFESFILVVGPLVALWMLSPVASLLALLGYVVIMALCQKVDRIQKAYWAREAEAFRLLGTTVVDYLRHVLSIYALRWQGHVRRTVLERVDGVHDACEANIRISETKWAVVDVIATACAWGIVLLYIVTQAPETGEVALGNVFMVLTYAQSGLAALIVATGNLSNFMRQSAEFGSCIPLLAIEPEAEPGEVPSRGWARLEIDGLAYSYANAEGGDRPVFENLTFSLQRGRHYALVGSNGVGKSTLLKLLSGLVPPTAGTLRVDGGAMEFSGLRRIASLVPQQTELFEGTIDANLDADMSNGQRVGGDSPLVELLFDPALQARSEVSEGGANYSGGQRQRIALARGILAGMDHSVLLLDEPTSSIDAATERAIVGHLRSTFWDSCLVVSTHNLELIGEFDEVLELRERTLSARPAVPLERRSRLGAE